MFSFSSLCILTIALKAPFPPSLPFFFLFFLPFFFCFVELGSLVAPAVLKLTISSCLHLPSTEITNVYHQAQLSFVSLGYCLLLVQRDASVAKTECCS